LGLNYYYVTHRRHNERGDYIVGDSTELLMGLVVGAIANLAVTYVIGTQNIIDMFNNFNLGQAVANVDPRVKK